MTEKTTIDKLYEKLPEEGIQRTKGKETRRGYDTTGYSYQYVVDHFNKVLGLDWGYDYDVVYESIGQYGSGQQYHEITVNVSIWVESKENARKAPGGHKSPLHSDALKGAVTNGLKKCAGMWGVGADAFRGEIDDDHTPVDDGSGQSQQSSSKRLDFDDVRFALNGMSTREEKVEYYKEIMKEYNVTPNMKPILDKIFKESTTPEVDGQIGELFDETIQKEANDLKGDI